MTGWSENESTHEPISKVSIGFLEDLGFTVDYNMAENYTVSGALRNNRRKGRGPVVAQREISRHAYPFEPIRCGCKI